MATGWGSRGVSPPHYRTVLAVDIEDSTTRTNQAKARLRDSMYGLAAEAFTVSGIGERHRDPFIDRGDGLLALIRPADEVPKTLLLSALIPVLSQLLTRHNLSHPEDQFRLRAVLHAGEVHFDSRGRSGRHWMSPSGCSTPRR